MHFCLDEDCENPVVFWFMGDLAHCSLGLDSSGFTSPEFHFDFWFWTNPKKGKKKRKSPDEPANFHMISTQNYKLCPLDKWKTVFITIGFPNAINWSYFYVSEEDNPNSSDFSRMRGSNIQLIFTESLFTREVVLWVEKDIRVRAWGLSWHLPWENTSVLFLPPPLNSMHWAFQERVKHSRISGCDSGQEMPFP